MAQVSLFTQLRDTPLIIGILWTILMNFVKLVIPSHSLYWSIHTKDESKHATGFVNWLWRCGVTASFGVFVTKWNVTEWWFSWNSCNIEYLSVISGPPTEVLTNILIRSMGPVSEELMVSGSIIVKTVTTLMALGQQIGHIRQFCGSKVVNHC